MKKDIAAITIVVLIICIFCGDILLYDMSPNWGDIPLQFYPWKVFTRTMLADGQIPYWNLYTYGGAPFFANMQSAVLYPLDLVLFLFPMERFYGLSLLLHLLLAGTGAYLFARICGATAFPSVIAGVAYGLNGFTMIHIPAGNHLTYAGAAWVPWILFATVGFVKEEKSKLPWALAGCFIAFLHFLCGHPQMTFYSLVFSALLCFVMGYWQYCRIERKDWFYPVLRTFAWCLFLVLGILMAGFQLTSTLEYLGQANRASTLDVQMATEFSFAPHRLMTLLFPEYYGTQIAGNHYDYFYFWSCAYAGVLVPVFALVLLFKPERPKAAIPLAIVALLGLFLAWGRGNPVYTMLLHLPGFGHFRAPAKYLPYYLAPICALAALGLERICGESYSRQKKDEGKYEVYRRVVALGILLILILPYGAPQLQSLRESIRNLDAMENRDMIRMLSMAYGGLIGLAGFALYLWTRGIPWHPRMVISLSFALLLAVDLFAFGKGYLDICLWTPAQIRQSNAPPQEIGFLDSQKNNGFPFRIATMADIYYPNKYIVWETYNLAGYDPMSLNSYNRQIGEMEGWEEGEFHDNIQLTTYDHPVLNQLNVHYILTKQDIVHEDLKLLYTTKQAVRIYKRFDNKISWASVQPYTSEKLTKEQEWEPADGQIVMKDYKPHSIQFTIQNEEQSIWLRLSEWFYPGWKATATQDGENHETEIVRSKDGLRAMHIPQGTWNINMEYRSAWSGWILSLFSILLFLVLLLFCLLIYTNWMLKMIQRIMGRNY